MLQTADPHNMHQKVLPALLFKCAVLSLNFARRPPGRLYGRKHLSDSEVYLRTLANIFSPPDRRLRAHARADHDNHRRPAEAEQ